MLKSLYIKNFTLIEETKFEPGSGLNIITGETGAGKTILLDALGLTLGHRADPKTVGPLGKAIIEAEYDVKSLNLKYLFTLHDLDYKETLRIRREITKEGKSRAFVNDTPTTLSVLTELGAKLIEIHTQNSTYDFKSSANKLSIVDDYAQNAGLLKDYESAYSKLKEAKQKLEELKQQKDSLSQERDYNEFLLNELLELNPNAEADENIENEIDTLSNAEEISNVAGQSAFGLNGDENSLIAALSQIKSELKGFTSINKSLNGAWERLDSVLIELGDISDLLQSTADNTEANPEELLRLNERFTKLQSLLRKHNTADIAELVSAKDVLEEKSFNSNNIDTVIADKETEVKEALDNTFVQAKQLHQARSKAAQELSGLVEIELKRLEIKDAQFTIDLSFDDTHLNSKGADIASFLFSANAGREPGVIEKSASGGELSRVFFCIKSLLANKVQLPTLIFDEADTGVSGEVAQRMGILMEEIGNTHQVISITHLPQVASKGNNHYHVSKTSENNNSTSSIIEQNNEQRVQILAEMMQGKNPDESAQMAARNLLG